MVAEGELRALGILAMWASDKYYSRKLRRHKKRWGGRYTPSTVLKPR